jgi:hypothetical protein
VRCCVIEAELLVEESNLTSMSMLQEGEEDYSTEYLVQSMDQPEDDEGASDFEPGEGDNEGEEDDFEDEEDVVHTAVKEPVLSKGKRSRGEDDGKEERPLKQ